MVRVSTKTQPEGSALLVMHGEQQLPLEGAGQAKNGSAAGIPRYMDRKPSVEVVSRRQQLSVERPQAEPISGHVGSNFPITAAHAKLQM